MTHGSRHTLTLEALDWYRQHTPWNSDSFPFKPELCPPASCVTLGQLPHLCEPECSNMHNRTMD